MPSAFRAELLGARVPVIAEVKRHDADGRELLGQRSLSQIVSEYESAGAPCLSVVTGRWFGGSNELLRDVARVTDLPILKKDFIASERQIVEAKRLGASAVLLTAGILSASALARLIGAALRHDMTPFVEAASERELAGVVDGHECVVAINNKDIRRRERDSAQLERSLALLGPALQTGTRCPVSASGIAAPADVARLVGAGYAGVLVGTALLLADSVHAWMDDVARRCAAIEATA
ncbi:MAG: indole-3-glycerol phosphate synthase [Thermoleophilaceae bacterium]|nr:indole-3-glycerol phosphate synthase [Thermoleophilaceae bacterium]